MSYKINQYRFPFAADVNTTDVRDITVSRTRSAGHEV